MASQLPGPPIGSNRRSQVIGWVAFGALVVGAFVVAYVLMVVSRPGPGPYADGTVHQATADCTGQFGCRITLGSPDHVKWNGLTVQLAPESWRGHQVDGTLTIVKNWGMTDGKPTSATFVVDGTTVAVWGGRPDDHHPALPG